MSETLKKPIIDERYLRMNRTYNRIEKLGKLSLMYGDVIYKKRLPETEFERFVVTKHRMKRELAEAMQILRRKIKIHEWRWFQITFNKWFESTREDPWEWKIIYPNDDCWEEEFSCEGCEYTSFCPDYELYEEEEEED